MFSQHLFWQKEHLECLCSLCKHEAHIIYITEKIQHGKRIRERNGWDETPCNLKYLDDRCECMSKRDNTLTY